MVAAVAMETIPRPEASLASGGEGGESAAQGLAADMGGGGGKWRRGGKEPEVLDWWLVRAGIKTRGGSREGRRGRWRRVCRAEARTRRGLFQSNPNHVLDGTGRIMTIPDIGSGRNILRSSLVSKNFHPELSRRILRYMHGVLNIDEKTNYTVLLEIARRMF